MLGDGLQNLRRAADLSARANAAVALRDHETTFDEGTGRQEQRDPLSR